MTSRISVTTVAAIIGMSVSLSVEAFSMGSGSSNPRAGQRGMRAGPVYNRRGQGGIRIEKGMDEKGYYLTIHAGGMAPEDLLIQPMNGSLMISSSRMSQSETRDQAPDRSYRFSRSFGSFNRRISIPFDADTKNMERTDSDGVVTVFLPRLADQGQGQDFAPGQGQSFGPGQGQGFGPGQGQGFGPGQGSGPGLPPPSGSDGQGIPPSDQSQYPIPDQAPSTGDMPSAAPYGSSQPGFESGPMPGPGFDRGFGSGYPQQPGFAPPYGYGAYGPSSAPYGYNQPPPGQMPFSGEIPPAAPGYQTGSCTCPCPCPDKTALPESE